jgi:hypothetical protein
MSQWALPAANGTIIRAESVFTRANGSTGALGDLIFETDRMQSRDRGVAAWAHSYDAFPSWAGAQAAKLQDMHNNYPGADGRFRADMPDAVNDNAVILQGAE